MLRECFVILRKLLVEVVLIVLIDPFKINYLDEHDVNAFEVIADGNPFLLCTTMTHTPGSTTTKVTVPICEQFRINDLWTYLPEGQHLLHGRSSVPGERRRGFCARFGAREARCPLAGAHLLRFGATLVVRWINMM